MNLPASPGLQDGRLAFRIRFVAEAPDRENVLMEFADPYPRFARLEAIDPDQLSEVKEELLDDFFFLFIPGGSATAYELQKKSEQWIGKSAVEMVARSDRILWRPGQALMQGAPERMEETLAGLVDFAFHEGELRKLEREIEADWTVAENDIPLTHGVDKTAIKRRSHVNEMTRTTTYRRMRFARLERRLEKASLTLSGPARRIVSELALQTEVPDRLKSLDDRLEVFEDLYELANDRISEYSYYWSEFKIELWIVLILLVEVLFMGWELYLTWND